MRRLLLLFSALSVLACAKGPQYLIGNTPSNGFSDCMDGQIVKYSATLKKFSCQNESGGGGIPSGSILLTLGASCPTGFSESTALAGKTLFGTLAANADVGGTGGADAITPAGSNSAPAFTGNAVASNSVTAGTPAGSNSAPALTMNAYTPAGTNATSTVTPLGSNSTSTVTPLGSNGAPAFTGTSSTVVVNHVHVQSVNSASTGPNTGYGYDASTNTSVASGYSTANPTGGAASYTPAGTVAAPAFAGSSSTVAAQTFTGAASTVSAQPFTGTPATLTGSVAAPSFTGSELAAHQHTTTATGTVAAPAFTGTQFDNRGAFVKVIFCRKD